VVLQMNKEQIDNTVKKIVENAGKQEGVTEVAVGAISHSGLDVTVRMGETEKVEFNRDKSVEILVYKGKRKGAVSITDLTDSAVDQAIQAACRIADYTEEDQYAGLAEPELLAK